MTDHRRIGLYLFLASLSMLIGAAIVGYLVVRLRAETWPPPGIPGAPVQLWASTAVLLISEFSISRSRRAVVNEDQARLTTWLTVTFLLALFFLASQVIANAEVVAAAARQPRNLFSFTFLLLTGLHAVHVLCGLIPLGIVTVRARRGRYRRDDHNGLSLVITYWHYLGVVWVVMFALLML